MRRVLVGAIVWLGLMASLAGQGHGDSPVPAPSEKAGPAAAEKPVARKPGAPQDDLRALAERINRKMAEAQSSRPPKAPAGDDPRAAGPASAARPVRPRVTLDWRVPLVWPAELLTDESKF